jgi:hypothetical protein
MKNTVGSFHKVWICSSRFYKNTGKKSKNTVENCNKNEKT